MYKADYHMHTSMSPDSLATIESQLDTALAKGFDEVAITDHFEFDLIDDQWQLTMDLEQYQQTIQAMQERYKGRMRIKQGIEIGYETMYHDAINKLVEHKQFDFVLCSTHKCEHQELYYGGFFIGKEQKEAYQGYFEQVLETVKAFDYFDVYGHLDYVNRYGNYPKKVLHVADHRDVIDAILEVLIKKDKGLEVNTSGLRYGLGHFNPQIPVLERYLEKGGKIITIGSDSHYNDHVGYMWNEAALMLKNLGYEAYTTFENRKPIFHKI